MRDARTSLLLAALLLLLAPAGSAGKDPVQRAAARKSLRAALPAEARSSAATGLYGPETLRRLFPVSVKAKVTGPFGPPLHGVFVRARNLGLDLAIPPVAADGAGRATLSLPRGRWAFGVWNDPARGGRVVFGRVEKEISDPCGVEIPVPSLSKLDFRTGSSNRLAPPQRILLSTPDFTFVRALSGGDPTLQLLTAGDAPFLLLATAAPGDRDGFVLQRRLSPGDAVVTVDPENAADFCFAPPSGRVLVPRFLSTGPLPVDLSFRAAGATHLLVSGLRSIGMSLSVEQGALRWRFYPRPFEAGKGRRTFTGGPPFYLTAGYRFNNSPLYHGSRHSLSLRFFVRDQYALVLRFEKDNPISVDWSLFRGDRKCGSGRVRRDMRADLAPARVRGKGALTVKATLHAPGGDRDFLLRPHLQAEAVRRGSVTVWSYRELAANAGAFADWLNRLVHAFYQTNRGGPPGITVQLWTHMAKGIYGAGDWGVLYLAEWRMLGFTVCDSWDTNVVHELAHAFGYTAHDASFRAAEARAANRYRELVSGPTRIPAGNRHRAVFAAIAGRRPIPESIDAFVDCYFRQVYGGAKDRRRRTWTAAWTWGLTIHGYTGAVAEAAALSRAAGEPMGWLVRAFGRAVPEDRLAKACAELESCKKQLVLRKQRAAILKRWRAVDFRAAKDLGAEAAALRAEVGDRAARAEILLRIASEQVRRGQAPAARKTLVAALLESRQAGSIAFRRSLDRAVAIASAS